MSSVFANKYYLTESVITSGAIDQYVYCKCSHCTLYLVQSIFNKNNSIYDHKITKRNFHKNKYNQDLIDLP